MCVCVCAIYLFTCNCDRLDNSSTGVQENVIISNLCNFPEIQVHVAMNHSGSLAKHT